MDRASEERTAGDPEDEAELFDVLRQLVEPEGDHISLQEVVELDVLEVAGQDLAGLLIRR